MSSERERQRERERDGDREREVGWALLKCYIKLSWDPDEFSA